MARTLGCFLLVMLVSAGLGGAAFGTNTVTTFAFGTPAIVRDGTRDRVYCAVPAQNSVKVVDSLSLQVLATIFVGSQPNSVALSPDSSKLYVALLGSSSPGIVVIDLASLTIAQSIATTAPVRYVAVGANAVYSLESNDSLLTDAIRAYKTSDGTALSGDMTTQGNLFVYGGILKLSPDLTTLYYYQTGLSPSSWYRINVTSWPGTIAESGEWGENGQDMAISPDGQYITFASGAPYDVAKLKASDPNVSLGLFNTDAYPHAVTYSPDGNTLYTTHTEGSIDVWNANTYLPLPSIPAAANDEADSLEVSRDGMTLFAGTSTALTAYYIGPSSRPSAWHATPVGATANMADGFRTGAAHSSWDVYYYKGNDNCLWCVYLDGSTWMQAKLSTDGNVSDWLAFGTQYNLLCYQGKDGNLCCVYWNGSQWLTAQLGNLPPSVTVAGDVVVDTGWNIIYYRGSDSNIYGVQWNGNAWVHTSLGGTTTVKGNLAVDNKYHVIYYLGTDNQVWCYQWTGKAWVQVPLSSTANIAGQLAVDQAGLVVYYSASDKSGWCIYWSGKAWLQQPLDSSANMSISAASASSTEAYIQNYIMTYLDGNGKCEALYWNGSQWTNVLLGDGGLGLTGGLSLQPTANWIFARRNDGHVELFFYY